jgi:hypothetical protein
LKPSANPIQAAGNQFGSKEGVAGHVIRFKGLRASLEQACIPCEPEYGATALPQGVLK